MAFGGTHPEWGAIQRRFDELKALLPSLNDLPPIEASTVDAVLNRVAEEVEALRRRAIRDRIQVSGLHELVEFLLRGADTQRDLVTLTRYLQQVLDLKDVLLVRRLPAGGWEAYHAGGDGDAPGRVGLVEWRESWMRRTPTAATHSLKNSPAPSGFRASVDRAGRIDDPEAYPIILPLGQGTWAAVPQPEAARAGEGPPLALLCLAPAHHERTDEEWNPREIAKRVEGMLETLFHREAMEDGARFRRQLLEAMGDGLVALNPEGIFLEVNAAAARLLGRRAESIRGQPLSVLEGTAAALVQHLRRALVRQEDPEPRELTLGAQDRRIPVNVDVSLLRDDAGRFLGLVVNLTDLTTVRKMEEEIRRLDHLAALGRFSAGVAHEIRNPLAGIDAGVEYLASRMPADALEHEDLRFVRMEIRRLNRIVTDLLDYTRPRPLDLQPLEAGRVADGVRLALLPLLTSRQVEMVCQGVPSLLLQADPDRLHQVLVNLVRNAVEASPPRGLVRLEWEAVSEGKHARNEGAPEMRGRVRFRVADKGPGLSPEDQARVFEPFFTTKGSGTGLGLYLSHSIVEQHGGRLLLESAPGRGTTAVLELPGPGPERLEEDAVVHSDR